MKIPLLIMAVCLARTSFAALPALTALEPRGAQQGKTITLTLTGRELLEGSRIITTLPAIFTPLTPTMTGFPFLVELRADAAVGTYPIRIQNQNGLSNILLFTVGSFPEIEEQETPGHLNNSIATAEAVKSVPVTVNGTLKGADRDFYRVTGKAGERRVFEVEARRCGSAIDPVLELFDEKGTLLARNEDSPGIGVDARLDFTFPHDGNYFAEVHDARFSRQDQNFYRLKMGAYNYPEAIFPLGGRHGETVTFEFSTKSGPVKTSVKLPETGSFATVALPGSPALPLRVGLSDGPEYDGRILKAGQMDRYPVKVSPGEALLIELQSRELGISRLDGLITVFDGKGTKLASAGDTAPPQAATEAQNVGRTQGDAFLNFTVPADTHEITVAVEDLAQRAGNDFGYRLAIRRQAQDFTLSASPAFLNVPRGGTAQIVVNADRRGYDGAIRATIPTLPRGWSAEGGFIAPETLDASGARFTSRRGVLTVSVAPDAELPPADLHIVAEVKLPDGSTLHRTAAGLGTVIDVAAGTGLPDGASMDRQKAFTAPWLNLAMPAAMTTEPSATISVKPLKTTRMAEGDAFDFEWIISTSDKSIAMPATVSVDAPGARDLRVIDMKATSKGAATGTFRITTTRSTVPATYDLVVNANLTIGAQRENIVAKIIPWPVAAPEELKSETSIKTTAGSN